MFLLLDEISSVEDTQLFGAILIADLSTLGVEHAKQISPWRIHTMVKVIQVKLIRKMGKNSPNVHKFINLLNL